MTKLTSFSTPGQIEDLQVANRDALHAEWQRTVKSMFENVNGFPQFYDPTKVDTPDDARGHSVTWHAFPASLNRVTTSSEARAKLADGSRDRQDEYCEWSVEGSGEEITKVTFTSEVPEYLSALWKVDPDIVLGLYKQHVSPDVELGELEIGGEYDARNKWNVQTSGPIMHLCQTNNSLEAAVQLAAQATVLRERDGVPVTDQQDLVVCGDLGNPFRNSDPQIAAAINGLAATGALITLSDPLGLYIDRIEVGGMELPSGVTVEDCWIPERFGPGGVVRARFQVPPSRGTVSDVKIDGAPVRSGAQLADRVVIRIGALSHGTGTQQPRSEECVPGG